MAIATLKEDCEVTGIKLDLNRNEVMALHILLGSVGGNSDNTIRKYTDGIYEVLSEQGVHIDNAMTYVSGRMRIVKDFEG